MGKLKDGWLQRQIDRAPDEVAKWPEWMKKGAGMAESTDPYEQQARVLVDQIVQRLRAVKPRQMRQFWEQVEREFAAALKAAYQRGYNCGRVAI